MGGSDMKQSIREITKIAREVSKFTVRMMKAEGIGTAEFDFIHAVRKNPGITQAEVRRLLSLDKGACARRTASLESKGYLIRKPSEQDHRAQQLFATEKAERLKMSKSSIEYAYYDWLFENALGPEDREQFMALLHKVYLKNKAESKSGFVHVRSAVEEDPYEEV